MNLADITTKCFILAMIVRDDGERILLGDGAYEFKDNQLHFLANTYANDVVELQGSDGQMLAGQVRRTATQTFAGYIGDATFSKQAVESARRDFFLFFRKKHYYTAVYIFPDGTAIQRKRGYIVNAPSAPELWQKYPEWSIGLNFEDPNYYEYAEDDQGNEIFAHAIEIALAGSISGGLIWDNLGAISAGITWSNPLSASGQTITINNAADKEAPLASVQIDGNATQTTYTGKNLLPMKNTTRTISGVTFTRRADGSVALSGTATAQINYPINVNSTTITRDVNLDAGTYTISWGSSSVSSGVFIQVYYAVDGGSGLYSTGTFTVSGTQATLGAYIRVTNGTNANGVIIYPMLEKNSTATAYEPYVGNTPAPNPNYPQGITVVTGTNTVRIAGANSQSRSYTVSLGSTWLAKIGTYEDYIWKDGATWKLHRAIGKVTLNGSEAWSATGGGNGYRIEKTDIALTPSGTAAPIMSNYFTATTFSSIYNATVNYGISNHNSNHWIVLRNQSWTSASNVTTWLAANNTTVYYALATPTDTEITDQTLVNQLNALGSSALYVGQNTISTTTANATPKLDVQYYTTYVETDSGYEWEAGGSPDNMITIDGVDSAYPVWTITGPATNPTLTNITTNQTITWTGFVPNGQTLTIDMAEMTASLAGANVFEFVSGSWIELQPGNNKLSYSASGGATEPSTLSWNGVVG